MPPPFTNLYRDLQPAEVQKLILKCLKVSEKRVCHQQTGIIMQLYVPPLEYFLGSCKSNQISTPAFSNVSLQSVLVICMAWKPVPASNASPEHILLQFQLITTCFIHDGCRNLTKFSLQIPFKKSFLQTKTSVFPDWKATLEGVFFFFFWGSPTDHPVSQHCLAAEKGSTIIFWDQI